MSSAIRYLEAEKVEEIATTLRSQGFSVEEEARNDSPQFDLVATKADTRIAVEVKAGAALRESAQEIRALRDKAHRQGFSEFRLVVVNPPRATSVAIDDLGGKLARLMIDDFPAELEGLAAHTAIESVNDLEVEALTIDRSGINVTGNAIVNVLLSYGGAQDDGTNLESDFPFRFDIRMDHALKIVEHRRWFVDTSSVRDEHVTYPERPLPGGKIALDQH